MTLTYKFRDRVWDTTTSVGTGVVTVSGAPPDSFRTLSAVLTNGESFLYEMSNRSAAEWEVGIAQYIGSNQFTRTASAVQDGSSGPGTLVNFSAGTKDVVNVAPALLYQNGSFRTRLTATTDVFVDPNLGTDDDAHGFSSGTGAWLTPQFASDLSGQYYDLAGQLLRINISNGTVAGVSLNGHYSSVNNGRIYFKGPVNGASGSLTITNCTVPSLAFGSITVGSFFLNSRCGPGTVYYYANNMRMAPTLGPCVDHDPIVGGEDCRFFLGDPISFTGTVTLAGCASGGGFVLVGNVTDNCTNITVDGTAINPLTPKSCFLGINHSQMFIDSATWTVNGTVTFSRAFAWMQDQAYIEVGVAMGGGAGVIGPRFLCERGANMVMSVAGTAGSIRKAFPGSLPGILRAGGNYIDQTVGTNPIATSAGPCGIAGENVNRQTPATGSYSLVANDYDGIIIIDPTVSSSGGTLTTCANPLDRQRFKVQGGNNAGGTLTVVANAGQSIAGVSTFPMPQGGDLVFVSQNNTWYGTRA